VTLSSIVGMLRAGHYQQSDQIGEIFDRDLE